MRQCQTRAKTSLIEDGMTADEAEEAVQPPSSAEKLETDRDRPSEAANRDRPFIHSDDSEPENVHNLKQFSISLKRVWYIEMAVEKGCKSIQIVPYKSGAKPKFIFMI